MQSYTPVKKMTFPIVKKSYIFIKRGPINIIYVTNIGAFIVIIILVQLFPIEFFAIEDFFYIKLPKLQ